MKQPPDLAQMQSAIQQYCRTLTEHQWDAEDLAQETWSKAIGSNGMERHANPQALLMRIAKTTWIDRCRKRKAAEAFERREKAARREESARSAQQPSERLELEPVFQALIHHMTPLQRAVFLLRDVFGFSGAESAEKLNLTEGAVKAALHRARLSLDKVRRELESAHRDPDVAPREPDHSAQEPDGASSNAEDGPSPSVHRLVAAYVNGDVDAVIRLVAGISPHPLRGGRGRVSMRSGRCGINPQGLAA